MTFGILFLIAAAGLLGPVLSGSRRLSLPEVAGEILAGIIIGNSGFALLDTNDPTLQFLSSVGLGMLLFLVGTRLALSGDALRHNLRKGIIAAVVTFAVAVPFGFGLAHITDIGHPFLFVLLCAGSSASTVMPMLAERKLSGPTVTFLSTWIPILDVTSLVLLPLAAGNASPSLIVVGGPIMLAVGALAFFALKLFRSTETGERYRQLSKERRWALDLRLQLLVLFGLSYLAVKFGTSVMVAGFITGIVSAIVGQPKRFNKQLTGLAGGFFVPMFFVCIGAKLDVRALVSTPSCLILAVCIAAASLATHVIACMLMKVRLSAGVIAAQQMGLPAAVVALGLSAKILSAGQATAVVAAAILTLGACTFAVNRVAKAELNGQDNHPGDKS